MKNLFVAVFIGLMSFSLAQEKINVGDFNSLEVFDKLKVELVQSNQNHIEISGEQAENVEYVNKNDRLKIRMKIGKFLGGENTKIVVYYKNLYSVSASEGAQILSDEVLKAPSLSFNAKEGAGIHLEVNTKNVDIKSSSGGMVELKGKTVTQDVICNAGGVYAGEKLKSQIAKVTVNAGGEAEVYAEEKVDAKTRAGGNIHIFGGAEVSQKNVVGGKVYIH